MRWPNKFKT
jgi:hypothetical protein